MEGAGDGGKEERGRLRAWLGAGNGVAEAKLVSLGRDTGEGEAATGISKEPTEGWTGLGYSLNQG